MLRSRFFWCAATFVLLSGVLIQGSRVLSQQRSQRKSLQQATARLETELAAQRREHDATARDLALAEHQLVELTGPDDTALSDPERAQKAEIAAWLARVKRLQQLFEQRPDQRIPEMRLLTNDDWLRIGKRLDLGDEEGIRRAFGTARSAAKKHLISALQEAVSKFSKASHGERPATALALEPYLENPADAEFLSRLEITHMATSAEAVRQGAADVGWAVQEKTPVDADYDSREVVYSNGGASITKAPLAWIPDFDERSGRAAKDYSAANNGAAASGLEPLLPYFNPPIDPAMVEKLLKARGADGW